MNKIILAGRLVKNAEAIPSGKAVKFTLAVARAFQKDKTDFINCIAFGKSGDTIAQYTQKGDQLIVEGALQIDKNEKNGQAVYYTTVAVNSFEFGAKGKSTSNGNASTSETNNHPIDGNNDMYPVDDGDIPF